LAKTQAPKQARRINHKPHSRAWAIGGLAVLAVAAVAVTAVAMGSSNDADAPTELAPAPTFSAPTPTPTPTPTPEPEPEAPVAVAAVPNRILSASDEPALLLRAMSPGCGDGNGLVEVSFDDGANWQEALTTNSAGASLKQINANDSSLIRITFADDSCQPQQARSFTGGLNWEPDESGESLWMLDGSSATRAWTPAGEVSLPCEAVSLVGAGQRAIALCNDSGVTVSEDGGSNWAAPVAVPAASAVGVAANGFIVASTAEPGCEGVRTRILTNGSLGEPGGCVESGAAAEDVAIAASPSALYLWLGDQLVRSYDGGFAWS